MSIKVSIYNSCYTVQLSASQSISNLNESYSRNSQTMLKNLWIMDKNKLSERYHENNVDDKTRNELCKI
jgi:hypothetical protein